MTKKQIEEEIRWSKAQVDTLHRDLRKHIERIDHLNELLETKRYADDDI